MRCDPTGSSFLAPSPPPSLGTATGCLAQYYVQSPRERLVHDCEKFLPGLAWLLLSKTCIPFPGLLYMWERLTNLISFANWVRYIYKYAN